MCKFILLLLFQLTFSTAFTSPYHMVRDISISETHRISSLTPSLSQRREKIPSDLKMGFNLPPSNPKDAEMKAILTGIGSVALATAFFLSPLGSIFFAITNSLFLLLFLLPIIAGIGFNAWQYFYTIEGPCPSCGAPARVLKDDDGQPGLCLNCGSTIRATVDKKGIELCNGPNDMFDDDNLGSFSSVFDLFRDDFNPDGPRRQDNKAQKKSTKIIDVEVKRDD
jgi:hypothetical protein